MSAFCECDRRSGWSRRHDGENHRGDPIYTPVCDDCRRPVFNKVGML